MNVQENISLKPFNTVRIDAKAQYYAPFTSVNELSELIGKYPRQPLLILGGGSNILFTKDVAGLVLKNEIKGIDKIKEDGQYIYVRVENLSLIPGNVGASPMQNIGAYGVEIKDVFHELKAWHLQEKCNYTFSLKDCEFGYRESVFKRKYKGQFVITSVCFRLNKQPVFNTSYGAIEQELAAMNIGCGDPYPFFQTTRSRRNG
jgi:UDP-N-acetylmuramate dehydrogenase